MSSPDPHVTIGSRNKARRSCADTASDIMTSSCCCCCYLQVGVAALSLQVAVLYFFVQKETMSAG